MIVPTQEAIDETKGSPSQLYKYREIDDLALDALSQRKFWFASPESFNDPFDSNILVPAPSGYSKIERAFIDADPSITPGRAKELLAGAIDQMNMMAADVTKSGILSLSSTPYELLMWSHYAKSHAGMCLQLERHNGLDLAKRVDYGDKMPVMLKLMASEQCMHGEAISKVLLTKAKSWQYEREWRINLFPKDGKMEKRLLEVDARLQAVIFGCKTSPEDIKRVKSAVAGHGRVEFYIMETIPEAFRLKPTPI